MKHLLFFIAFLLSFCIHGQLISNFPVLKEHTSYLWQGDLNKYAIEENGIIQLNAQQVSSEATLYLRDNPFINNEWSLLLKSSNTGTAYNFVRIYLWSEQPNAVNPGHAIVVRIGYTKNNISLYHQSDGEKMEVIFEGRNLPDGPVEIQLKATVDENRKLTLYSKLPSDSDFIKEGQCIFPTDLPVGYFMLHSKYTASNSKSKTFGNVHIARFETEKEDEKEEEGLYLLQLNEVSAQSLTLRFNRAINEENSGFLFHLSQIGDIEDIMIDELSRKVILLSWQQPLIKGNRYTVYWADLYDDNGNENSGNQTFTSILGHSENEITETTEITYDYGSVIINEVMADPNGLTQLPQTEYVELHNTTPSPISLKNWKFIYDTKETLLSDQVLPANGYMVLYRAGRNIHIDNNGLQMPLSQFPMQLANGGKGLALADPGGYEIDRMYYPKAKSGISWERNGDDWYLSTDKRGGTPGSLNSSIEEVDEIENEPVEPKMLVWNEILPDPFTGGSEYAELYNRSGQSLPLSDLSVAIRKQDGSFYSAASLHAIKATVPEEGYVVLTRNKEGVIGFYDQVSDKNIYEVKLPVLANTTSTLVLYRTSDGTVIDEVSYSSKWHSPGIKDHKGVALERIDPQGESNDPANWSSASSYSGFGTPGYSNSQKKGNSNTTHIDAPLYNKETDEYLISYYLNEAGYNCRAWIYNMSGMRVAEIANHELLGTNGALLWNGIGNNGSRLKTGIYILYIEFYHPNGQTKQFKKVFLVH